jgi:hypothetical protein
VVLAPGQQVRLAKDLYLHVVSIDLADQALAIVIDQMPAQLLLGSSASLLFDPEPGLVQPYRRDAAALLWSDGLGWRIQVQGEEPQPFAAGLQLEIGDHSVRAELISVQRAGIDATALGGRLHPPLGIIANYDTAHIHRVGLEPVILSGIAARIMGELVAIGGPATWVSAAEQPATAKLAVKALVGMAGSFRGSVAYAMDRETARPIYARMSGDDNGRVRRAGTQRDRRAGEHDQRSRHHRARAAGV